MRDILLFSMQIFISNIDRHAKINKYNINYTINITVKNEKHKKGNFFLSEGLKS